MMFPVLNQWEESSNGAAGLPPPEECPLTAFDPLEKGKYYLKLGHSTGVTADLCNGALACCNWTGRNVVRYDHNGEEIINPQEISEEYIIISKRRGLQASFAEHGDSGSFFIDIFWQCVWIIFRCSQRIPRWSQLRKCKATSQYAGP